MGTVGLAEARTVSPKRPNLWGPLELIWLTASCFGRLRRETEPQSALINTILMALTFQVKERRRKQLVSQILLGECENS